MKRFFDLMLSIGLLLVTLPIMLLLCIPIFIKLGYPIFFTQIRPGKNEKLFKLIKFRTMKNLYNENGELLHDSLRLKPFGSFLRSTSLDELPGLWNVVKGDMSLVGPRPLLIEYLPLYNDQQSRRHEVKPGITGLAQIKGRNSLSWEEKFNYDIYYVDNFNMVFDIKILLSTIILVFKKRGISPQGNEIMPEFFGNKKNGTRKL